MKQLLKHNQTKCVCFLIRSKCQLHRSVWQILATQKHSHSSSLAHRYTHMDREKKEIVCVCTERASNISIKLFVLALRNTLKRQNDTFTFVCRSGTQLILIKCDEIIYVNYTATDMWNEISHSVVNIIKRSHNSTRLASSWVRQFLFVIQCWAPQSIVQLFASNKRCWFFIYFFFVIVFNNFRCISGWLAI